MLELYSSSYIVYYKIHNVYSSILVDHFVLIDQISEYQLLEVVYRSQVVQEVHLSRMNKYQNPNPIYHHDHQAKLVRHHVNSENVHYQIHK